MPRTCDLTGTGVRFGRNVAHSNKKTSRTFAPNLQKTTLTSDALKRRVSLRVTTRALRTVQRKGGLDGYLLGTADADLGGEALRLKRQVKRALAGAAKPASD